MKILSSKEIIYTLMDKAGVENENQYAIYLANKYGIKVHRSQFNQLRRIEGRTLTHLLLREAIN